MLTSFLVAITAILILSKSKQKDKENINYHIKETAKIILLFCHNTEKLENIVKNHFSCHKDISLEEKEEIAMLMQSLKINKERSYDLYSVNEFSELWSFICENK